MNKLGIVLITQFFLLSVVTFSQTLETAKCPLLLKKIPDVCKKFKCDYTIDKDLCPSDTIYNPAFGLCGCCPKCVRYLYPGEEKCVPNNADAEWTQDVDCEDEEYCPVKVNQCFPLPGIFCNTTIATASYCVLNDEWVPEPATEECMFRKLLRRMHSTNDKTETKLHHWDPDCEADGSFAPKQCKGTTYDGECLCVDARGKRLFGREWWIDAENQTCACSRKMSELRNEQRYIASFHCAANGNYEPLQCDTDSGLCYCVDEKTGALDGSVVSEVHWKTLPCYSVNLTNWEEDGKYLRQCESEYAAGKMLQIVGKDHGHVIDFKSISCDFDGSFSPAQSVNTQTECVFQNGTRIKDFFKFRDLTMTCNCARDTYQYYPSEDRPKQTACQIVTGNYEPAYDFGSYASCVDRDGFLYGDIAPSKYMCCLLGEGCAQSVIDNICYNIETKEGEYRPCSWWRFRN